MRFVRELFSFPNPVNEKAARVVAGVVFVTALLIPAMKRLSVASQGANG